MTERHRPQQDDLELPDLEDGVLPDVDLGLGSDAEISGGDDLARLDEENLYGNDVLVGPEDDED